MKIVIQLELEVNIEKDRVNANEIFFEVEKTAREVAGNRR